MKKYFCHCETVNGEIYLPIKAINEVEATAKIHEGYKILYVIDTLTREQMESRKKHLKPGISAGVYSLT